MTEKIFDRQTAIEHLTTAVHNALCPYCPPDGGPWVDGNHRHSGDGEHTIVAAALSWLPSLLHEDSPESDALRRVLGLKWETGTDWIDHTFEPPHPATREERAKVRPGVYETHRYSSRRLISEWKEHRDG